MPPDSLTSFAIAADASASSSSLVISFGSNQYAQSGWPDTPHSKFLPQIINQEEPLKSHNIDVTSASYLHSLFLESETGAIFSVGDGHGGETATGSRDRVIVPQLIDTSFLGSGKKITAVETGFRHSLFLEDSGDCYCSGENIFGACGDKTTTQRLNPAPVFRNGAIQSKKITLVSAGYEHSHFLAEDGTCYAAGRGSEGQLGTGETVHSHEPVPIKTTFHNESILQGKTIISVSGGAYHTLFLTSEHIAYATGLNDEGALGVSPDVELENHILSTPMPVDTSGVLNGKTITAISAGYYHSVFLTSDGIVAACGSSKYGQLGDGSVNTVRLTPVLLDLSHLPGDDRSVKAISAGGHHTLLIVGNHRGGYGVGSNSHGQLSADPSSQDHFVKAIPIEGHFKMRTISAGGRHTLAIAEEICPTGQFRVDDNSPCKNCSIGSYSPYGTTCEKCKIGMFSDQEGSTTCSLCPAGTASSVEGATSLSTCKTCPAGSYTEKEGASECSLCEAGKFSTIVGSNSSAVCTSCPKGSYSDKKGSKECTLCPVGTSSHVEGATAVSSCVPCSAGSYAEKEGTPKCTLCGKGYYSSTEGASSASVCVACPAGTQSSVLGASNSSICLACPAGYYAPTEASTECLPCGIGSFAAGEGSTKCTKCPAGYYAPTKASKECTPCPVGSASIETGATSVSVCKPCGLDHYADKEGSTKCEACASGLVSLTGSGSCIYCPDPENPICSEVCSGHGYRENGNCQCAIHYYGSNCETHDPTGMSKMVLFENGKYERTIFDSEYTFECDSKSLNLSQDTFYGVEKATSCGDKKVVQFNVAQPEYNTIISDEITNVNWWYNLNFYHTDYLDPMDSLKNIIEMQAETSVTYSGKKIQLSTVPHENSRLLSIKFPVYKTHCQTSSIDSSCLCSVLDRVEAEAYFKIVRTSSGVFLSDSLGHYQSQISLPFEYHEESPCVAETSCFQYGDYSQDESLDGWNTMTLKLDVQKSSAPLSQGSMSRKDFGEYFLDLASDFDSLKQIPHHCVAGCLLKYSKEEMTPVKNDTSTGGSNTGSGGTGSSSGGDNTGSGGNTGSTGGNTGGGDNTGSSGGDNTGSGGNTGSTGGNTGGGNTGSGDNTGSSGGDNTSGGNTGSTGDGTGSDKGSTGNTGSGGTNSTVGGEDSGGPMIGGKPTSSAASTQYLSQQAILAFCILLGVLM